MSSSHVIRTSGGVSHVSLAHSHTTDRSKLSGQLSPTVSLMIAAVGAGILSFPYAVLQQGLLINVLVTFVFATFSSLTDMVLISASRWLMDQDALKLYTFDEVVGTLLGHRAYRIAQVSVYTSVYGSLIGFLIIIGDLSQPVAKLAFGQHSFFASVEFLIPAAALTIALPLSFCKDLHSLRGSSAFAILSVFVVCGAIVWRGIESVSDVHVVVTGTPPQPSPPVVADAITSPFVRLFHLAPSVFVGLPICVFSLGNHLQVVPVTCEQPRRVRYRMQYAVLMSVVSVVVLYLLTGAFGYVKFGQSTPGNILNGFKNSDTAVDVAKGVMALHVVLAFPVVMFPARRALELTVLRMCDDWERSGEDISQLKQFCLKPQVAAVFHNVIVIILASVVAVAIPQIQVVFGLLGSTTSVSQMYIFPGLIVVYVCRSIANPPRSPSLQDTTATTPLNGPGSRQNSVQLHAMPTPQLYASRSMSGKQLGYAAVDMVDSLRDFEAKGGVEDDCFVNLFPFQTTLKFRLYVGYLLICVGMIVGGLGTTLTIMGML